MKLIKWDRYEIAIEKVKLKDPSGIFTKIQKDMQIVSVKCWEQLAFATISSLKAFERNTNKARTITGEILLRLAGTLQIHEAISKVGAKKGENFMVAFGEDAARNLESFIEENNLQKIPFKDCDVEKVKELIELAALVDVL
ncbi:hypothetical protein DRN39_05110 [Thermococci archaeon]|nr:MAG: hypothetical protein DRN39_05110 [Thermococci archaeon]